MLGPCLLKKVNNICQRIKDKVELKYSTSNLSISLFLAEVWTSGPPLYDMLIPNIYQHYLRFPNFLYMTKSITAVYYYFISLIIKLMSNGISEQINSYK